MYLNKKLKHILNKYCNKNYTEMSKCIRSTLGIPSTSIVDGDLNATFTVIDYPGIPTSSKVRIKNSPVIMVNGRVNFHRPFLR